jgi:hypothetical protein
MGSGRGRVAYFGPESGGMTLAERSGIMNNIVSDDIKGVTMSGLNEQQIPISFPRQQWEHILTMLARQPFNEVAPLISEIQRQFRIHEMQQQRAHSMPPPRLVPEDYGPIIEKKDEAV